MRENILNIPHHIRRLRVVSSERVALVMAGEYTFNRLQDIDFMRDPDLWQAANSYHSCIGSAIKNEGLECITIFTDHSGVFTRARFKPEIIWPWALAELSDSSLWYGAGETLPLSLPSVILNPADEALTVSGGSNENLQLLSAGLARLLITRSHNAYLHGKKTNISALARDAAGEVACALPPDADKTETFRKLLTEVIGLLPSDAMPLDK
jgi:hypothetical protein